MDHFNEHYSKVVIRDINDVWSAMFNYEIEAVFGEVLDYFMKESHQKGREDFKILCHTLDKYHLNEILTYFLKHYDQEKMLMFFESIDMEQQAHFLIHLVHNVCDEGDFAYEKNIIQFRKALCHWRAKSPGTVDDALKEADQNAFQNLIQFFRKHSDQTLKFIGKLHHKNPQRAKEIIGGIILELFSYLPTQSEDPDDTEILIA